MLINEMGTTAENVTSLLGISLPVNNLSVRGGGLEEFLGRGSGEGISRR